MKRHWIVVGLLVAGLVVFGFAGNAGAAVEAKAAEYRTTGDMESPRQPGRLILDDKHEGTELRDMVPILA